MSSVNKVVLIGHVGKDPEIRTMQNGSKVASFSVATSEKWKDKQTGELREKTEWHRVAVFNENIISVVERFVKKGSKVYLEGTLETRKWQDTNGVERHTTEVILKAFRGELVLLDGREPPSNQERSGVNEYAKAKNGTYQPPQSSDIPDDDIPF